MSTHGACTAVFVAVGALVGFFGSSVRTLGRITWLAGVGLPSILLARKAFPSRIESPCSRAPVVVVTIAVGVQDRPASAPMTSRPWVSDYRIVGDPTFPQAISAVASLVFAYSGSSGFFSIVSEMRRPSQYTRALIVCKVGVTLVYCVIGCLLYYYCGSYVASPALGSAGGTVKKVCYGLALPGLVATTTIVAHVRLPCPPVFTPLISVDPIQVHIRPSPPRLSPSHQQLPHALAHLARLYTECYGHRLHHRQRHSLVRRPGIAHRCPTGHTDLLPTHGLYVVIRSLAQRHTRVHKVVLYGRLEYPGHRDRDIPDGRGDVWIGCSRGSIVPDIRRGRGVFVCG